ncbi:MAG: hypothetical protein RL260_1656 [Pseudomonadota bacterium]|jgi:hypothetical protein
MNPNRPMESLRALMDDPMNAAAAFVLPEMGRRGPAPVTSSLLLQPMV